MFEWKITTVRVTMIPFRVLTLGRTRGGGAVGVTGVIIVPLGVKNRDFVPLRVFESKITTVRVTMIPFRVLS